jgi:thymidylate synthase
VSRHAHWIHDDNLELIIKHDQLNQLDNVIDDLEHDHDDNDAIMRYWILYICVGR